MIIFFQAPCNVIQRLMDIQWKATIPTIPLAPDVI